MKSSYLLLVLTYVIAAHCTILLTEIERNPPGSETASPGGKSHEYIELFNCSDDTLTIDSLSLFDGVTTDKIEPRSQRLWYPGTVMLVLDQDYFSLAEEYPIPYPVSAVIASVNHTSILGGLSGSDGFQLFYGDSLVAELADTISESERFHFSSFYGEESDENVLESFGATTNREWRVAQPSPGELHELANDIFCAVSIESTFISISYFSFDRAGTIQLWSDDALLYESEVTPQIVVNDSIPLTDIPLTLVMERTSSIATIRDTLNLSHLRIPDGAVTISEVSPRGDVEWIELYNSSIETIKLDNWYLANEEDTCTIEYGIDIKPGEYLLLSKSEINFGNSSLQKEWFSLNNYRDTLFLGSIWGIEDSVRWESSTYSKWESESLHRIPDSDGFARTSLVPMEPTPGTASSLYTSSQPISLICSPNVFSPNGDGKDDSLKITVKKPSYYSCKVRIFSRSGIEIASFELDGDTGYWDGSSEGRTARRGPYVVLAEFFSTVSGSKSKRAGVVLWR